jgi:tRNA 2-thiocytidine biosynthesis protein TtcA
MKELLAQWEKIDKNRMYNIFKSMTHVVPSHLLDRSLWDFHEFHALTQPPKPLKPRRQSKN